MVAKQPEQSGIALPRRQLLGSLAIAGAAAGGAGCLGDGDGSGDDGDDTADDGDDDQGAAGERLPTIDVGYLLEIGATTQASEDSFPIVQRNLSDHIGLEVEADPVTVDGYVQEYFHDSRNHEMILLGYSPNQDRIDPHELIGRYHLSWAGANGLPNIINYANCDYTMAAERERRSVGDERREHIHEAMAQHSEDLGHVTLTTLVWNGAYRSDIVDVPESVTNSTAGILDTIADPYILSETVDGRPLITNIRRPETETRIHPTNTSQAAAIRWANYIYSPLVTYNSDFEIEGVLAEDWEWIADDQLVVEIRDDGVFHDGSPVTVEDVKFTFEWGTENHESLPYVENAPIESIEIENDTTVRFDFSEVYPFFLTRYAVSAGGGILPQDHWVDLGAWDDPEGFDLDPVIGSGPYELKNLVSGQSMELEPFDDHPVFSPTQDLIGVVYEEASTIFRDFEQGDVHIWSRVSPGMANRIEEDLSDVAGTTALASFTNMFLGPNHAWGPGKFKEFRQAVAQSVDRTEINQAAFFGTAEPDVTGVPFSPNSTWHPGEDALTVQGGHEPDEEAARSVLEENGWTWDDDGRLRYPDDADLTPVWPQGDTPMDHPDKFPCVDELS